METAWAYQLCPISLLGLPNTATWRDRMRLGERNRLDRSVQGRGLGTCTRVTTTTCLVDR